MWYLGPGFVSAGQPILDFLIHQCNISSRATMCSEWKSALFWTKKLLTVENSHKESTQGLEKVPKRRQISKLPTLVTLRSWLASFFTWNLLKRRKNSPLNGCLQKCRRWNASAMKWLNPTLWDCYDTASPSANNNPSKETNFGHFH